MAANNEIPWERYALIAEIVDRFRRENTTLGKTALQKTIFLLQRLFGVDCDYSYTLYTYGLYSADVARDLNIVEGFGAVDVLYDWGTNGYDIRPAAATEELRKRAAPFLKEIEGPLDRLIADFGQFTAKDLELRSTIIYLAKTSMSETDLVERVHDVKPHFSHALIEAAIRELKNKGYLDRVVSVADGIGVA
ncbi:MAG: hypothetical protein HY235_08985 [Acidobacteria bacterium]|nr:hypothetical protein [Acidobacteriota bacterium]